MTSFKILNNIQAGIVRSSKMDESKFLFIQFQDDKPAEVEKVLRRFKPTSAFEQEHSKKLILNFFISKHILSKLWINGEPILEGNTGIGNQAKSTNQRKAIIESLKMPGRFNNGMKDKDVIWDHSDPKLEKWESEYHSDIDALISISSNDEMELNKRHEEIKQYLENTGAGNIVFTENGKHIIEKIGRGKNAKKLYFEPFGYRDGIAMTKFFKKVNGEYQLMEEQLPLVLDDFDGSFLVFRKLKQDVKGFDEKVELLAKKIGTDHADPKTFIEGQIMGRFKNGMPITLSESPEFPDPNNPADIDKLKKFDEFYITPSDMNGLTYANNKNGSYDEEGLKCPFHAHIRKINPRNKKDLHLQSPPAIITRRSIPFKYANDNQGIFFICFQRNIFRQFTKLQQLWCNDSLYGKGNGLDPISGQSSKINKQKWNKNWNKNSKFPFSIQDFVQFMGGEFFYAPSLSFFEPTVKNTIISDKLDEPSECF